MSDERLIFTVCGVCKYKDEVFCDKCENYSMFENELQAENERLKQENEQLRNDIMNSEMNLGIMTQLAKDREEALRKCSPFNRLTLRCELCSELYQHTDDCSYIQLCGGLE